jgi:2-oxoglutarate dehydrogenase E2 component (dihydrolipoamide succinyltransferase)
VVKGRDLVEIVTDKATFDVPAPCDGILTKIKKEPGETVTTDEVIAVILEDE